jgi:hypothetical protein
MMIKIVIYKIKHQLNVGTFVWDFDNPIKIKLK